MEKVFGSGQMSTVSFSHLQQRNFCLPPPLLLVKSSPKHQGWKSLVALLLVWERNAVKSSDNLPRTAGYYLERAAECERLASVTVTEENREILRQLAARWRALAAEVSKSPSDSG